MKQSIALPEVKPADVAIPGQYVCYPAATKLYDNMTEMGMDTKTLKPQGMWIVEVFVWEKDGSEYLCYKSPDSGEDYLVESCDHTFYGPIPGTEGEEPTKRQRIDPE
jgi:hypothetical protein